MNSNKKYNLQDITFLFPVSIDSNERYQNLCTVIEFLSRQLLTNFIVLEGGNEKKVSTQDFNDSVQITFFEDKKPFFHKTRYVNKLCHLAETKFLAIWDTDVIIDINQILESVNMLRGLRADMVIPYDGRFLSVPAKLRKEFIYKMEVNQLQNHVHTLQAFLGRHSTGGAYFVNRSSYFKAGLENEKFYAWGPEDFEHVKRMEILGYKVLQTEGVAYHLFHPRKINSGHISELAKKEMLDELLFVCSRSTTELQEYVNSWN